MAVGPNRSNRAHALEPRASRTIWRRLCAQNPALRAVGPQCATDPGLSPTPRQIQFDAG